MILKWWTSAFLIYIRYWLNHRNCCPVGTLYNIVLVTFFRYCLLLQESCNHGLPPQLPLALHFFKIYFLIFDLFFYRIDPISLLQSSQLFIFINDMVNVALALTSILYRHSMCFDILTSSLNRKTFITLGNIYSCSKVCLTLNLLQFAQGNLNRLEGWIFFKC